MKCFHLRGWGRSLAIIAVASLGLWAYSATAKEKAAAKKVENAAASATAVGEELFNREWLPKDARARGGDGLGPVFNDTSCIACHNQGGAGGGGPASKNVDVVSVFANSQAEQVHRGPSTLPEAMFSAMFSGFGGAIPQPVAPQTLPAPQTGPVGQTFNATAPQAAAPQASDKKALAKKQREELAKIHPGFVTARSVVLHKASTDPAYDELRAKLRGEVHFSPQATSSLEVVADADIEGVESVTVDFTGAEPDVNVAVVKEQAAKPELQRDAMIATARAQQTLQRHRMSMQQFRSPTQGTQAQVENFFFVGSQRNPTALFGAGLIDSIPEQAIRENAEKKHEGFPEVQGRVAKLKDGKIGRFGWKGQTATLYDFAMTACAVELGLDVPDHPQAGVPHNPDYKSPGLDMNKAECNALVDYLKRLPAPDRTKPATRQEAEFLAAGEAKFAAVGCATCHTKDLGNAEGLYSDLLLHDMGQDLGDTGSYGIFIPNSPEEGGDEPIPSLQGGGVVSVFGAAAAVQAKAEREKTIGAMRQEWRTPPLWGVRDSGPYLHDGRADTLEQAIALHGGEAARSAQRFFELKPDERMQVMAFLKSLRAPQTQVAASR